MTPAMTNAILLLEDEGLIALDIESTLVAGGYTNIVTLSTCAQAKKWLEENVPALAILDMRLSDGVCTEIALRLSTHSIPFIIHSGAWPDKTEHEAFSAGHWLRKPAIDDELITLVRTLIPDHNA